MIVTVYDIETLKSCFTYTALDIKSNKIYQFVLHKDRNDWFEFINHLNQCVGQIGFNNVNFDYPIIHYILKNANRWPSLFNIETIVKLIHQEAQRIIDSQNSDNFNEIVAIKQKDVKIHQLDLFKIWHYNNKARSTSLKALEISMNFPNVMEMPIDHNREDISLDDIPGILEYNLNDVLATYEFYKKSLSKIELRKSLAKTYNIPCINWSDSKIGEQLILKMYCDETKRNVFEVKELRTFRHQIILKDCLLPYIEFKNKEFIKLHDFLKDSVITQTKGAFKKHVLFKGFKYDYGTGGIHGSIKSGIYKSDDDYLIIDADVGSLYPSLAIVNNFYPLHLGETFVNIYKGIVDLRLKAKKEGNSVLADGFKLAANSVYGKSNDVNSFLYDPFFTMCVTLNGQLLLSMLCERFATELNNVTMLQVNTDGVTVKIPRTELDKYYQICKEWQEKTKLVLEYAEYSKMIIADVKC